MKHSHVFTLCLFFLNLFLLVQARHHSHRKHRHSHSHKSNKTSLPQPPPPAPRDDDNGYYNNNASGIFDVRAFGAVGDGIEDDTEAFKTAWDTACQNESQVVNVILVPRGFSFVVQSTIFTGPCQGDLVFKVITNLYLLGPNFLWLCSSSNNVLTVGSRLYLDPATENQLD